VRDLSLVEPAWRRASVGKRGAAGGGAVLNEKLVQLCGEENDQQVYSAPGEVSSSLLPGRFPPLAEASASAVNSAQLRQPTTAQAGYATLPQSDAPSESRSGKGTDLVADWGRERVVEEEDDSCEERDVYSRLLRRRRAHLAEDEDQRATNAIEQATAESAVTGISRGSSGTTGYVIL
jgi:hypothetical protein